MNQLWKIIAAVQTFNKFYANTILNFSTGMIIKMEMTTKSEYRITWLIWHLQDQRVAGYHSFPHIRILWMCILMYPATLWTDLKLNLSSVKLSCSSWPFYQYLHGVSPKETNKTNSHRFYCCYLNSLFI